MGCDVYGGDLLFGMIFACDDGIEACFDGVG
jgi:hypothetical protein